MSNLLTYAFSNMKNSMVSVIVLGICLLLISACTHSIKIKGARFVAPITAKEKWGGFASISGGADTTITLVENIDGNPPTRNPIKVNQDIDAGDFLGFNYIGFEAGLSILKSVELYLDNTLFGLRWQFLNHGAGADHWVATIQAGYTSGSQGTSYEESSGSSTASSDITKTQGGLSFGYLVNENILPYVSYLYETYDVETKVTNSNGSFGPYDDKGNHQFIGLGIMNPYKGFLWAVEYNMILIDWDRATTGEQQDLVALRLGGSW